MLTFLSPPAPFPCPHTLCEPLRIPGADTGSEDARTPVRRRPEAHRVNPGCEWPEPMLRRHGEKSSDGGSGRGAFRGWSQEDTLVFLLPWESIVPWVSQWQPSFWLEMYTWCKRPEGLPGWGHTHAVEKFFPALENLELLCIKKPCNLRCSCI